MVKHNSFSFILIFLVMMLIACKPDITVVEVSTGLSQAAAPTPSQIEADNLPTSVVNENICQNPDPAHVRTCAAAAEQILATTVRIELRRWQEAEGKRGEYIDGGIGHATVKDGRYLVTHNHFGIPLAAIEGKAGEQVRISVYKANGEIILDNVPTSAFSVVIEDSETIVLDFGEYLGDGLFGMVGMPSAEFQSWDALSLTPGMEVAQINWDKETAFVEWVNIKSVFTTNGTPRIELDNGVIKGASGGGIFWNGLHIGNNWTSTTVQEANGGAVLDVFSAAALNAGSVVN